MKKQDVEIFRRAVDQQRLVERGYLRAPELLDGSGFGIRRSSTASPAAHPSSVRSLGYQPSFLTLNDPF